MIIELADCCFFEHFKKVVAYAFELMMQGARVLSRTEFKPNAASDKKALAVDALTTSDSGVDISPLSR
jgi:hypothetical protein